MSKFEDIESRLLEIKSDLPSPRKNLSEEGKKELILKAGGPKTVRSILKATKDFKLSRIPFLFNSIDSQTVVDILANDMEKALIKHEP